MRTPTRFSTFRSSSMTGSNSHFSTALIAASSKTSTGSEPRTEISLTVPSDRHREYDIHPAREIAALCGSRVFRCNIPGAVQTTDGCQPGVLGDYCRVGFRGLDICGAGRCRYLVIARSRRVRFCPACSVLPSFRRLRPSACAAMACASVSASASRAARRSSFQLFLPFQLCQAFSFQLFLALQFCQAFAFGGLPPDVGVRRWHPRAACRAAVADSRSALYASVARASASRRSALSRLPLSICARACNVRPACDNGQALVRGRVVRRV